VRRLASNVFVEKIYFSFGWLVKAGDNIKKRRFARTVWPYDHMPLALKYFDCDP
jgi:hypothetical protein